MTEAKAWRITVGIQRDETVDRLWSSWLKNPENWSAFINEVDVTFGAILTEDLYNMHDDWDGGTA